MKKMINAAPARQRVEVSDKRAKQLLIELEHALRNQSLLGVSKLLVINGAHDYIGAVLRRCQNISTVLGSVLAFGVEHSSEAFKAWKDDDLTKFAYKKKDDSASFLANSYRGIEYKVRSFANNPAAELLNFTVVALTALVSSGGIDGDGGLPDLDIPLLGIGAHRSPLTHSILIGAGAEAIIAALIRMIILIHDELPENHDPLWDEFYLNAPQLLAAISKGVSAGLAYHLMIDGFLQPAPYHGLPIDLPLNVHQTIQFSNGLAEGLAAWDQRYALKKNPATIAQHRTALREEYEVDEDLVKWLGAEAFHVLKRHGSWMLSLSTGAIQPYTASQVRFIAVAWQVLPAETVHEMAWVQYLNIWRIAMQVERNNGIFSRASNAFKKIF